MTQIRQYILSIIISVLICSILCSLVGKKGRFTGLIHIVCGLLVAFTFVSPWVDPDFDILSFIPVGIYEDDGQSAAEEGKRIAHEEVTAIIKEQTHAYILDKATSLGANISVEVEIDQQTNIPKGATINGLISPYEKSVLSKYMEDSLGIAEENQKWN